MKCVDILVGRTYKGKSNRLRRVIRRYFIGNKAILSYAQYNACGCCVASSFTSEREFARWARSRVG